MTHNETSTGVMNDVETLTKIVRQINPDTLIAVDDKPGCSSNALSVGVTLARAKPQSDTLASTRHRSLMRAMLASVV